MEDDEESDLDPVAQRIFDDPSFLMEPAAWRAMLEKAEKHEQQSLCKKE